MQRDLVADKKWFTKEEYLTGLALANLVPGPMATQLAIYLGYLKGGVSGATLVALAFTLPAFFCVLTLGVLYVHFGGLSWIQGAFYGVNAAVIPIIARAAWRLTGLAITRRFLWALFGLMAVSTYVMQKESLILFVLCGLAAVVQYRKRILGFFAAEPFMFLFFFKASATVFGTGLVIVPFLYSGVVKEYGWLTDRQFLDAMAVGMITPGPVVIAAAFIGYLAGGFGGAIAAYLGIFLPVYLFVVLFAHSARKLVENPTVKIFVDGVTAAALGALAAAALMLAQRAITDMGSILIACAALLILFKTKTPEPIIILGAAFAGWVTRL